MRRFAVLLLCCTLGASSVATAQTAISVPIARAWLGLIQTPVTLNGEVDTHFIVDTAATETVLADETITRLGITGSGVPTRVNGATGSTEHNYYRLRSLALGASVYRDIGAYDLPPSYRGIEAGGLLGADILRRHVVLFDLPGGELSLYPPRFEPRRLGGRWTSVPITQRPDGFLIVEVRIGSVRMPALVDTGAVHNFVNRAAARRLRLPIGTGEDALQPITGASGHIQSMAQTRLPGFAIGDAEFGASRLGIVDLAIFETLGLADAPAMILSAESLGNRRFVIDYPGDRMLVEL